MRRVAMLAALAAAALAAAQTPCTHCGMPVGPADAVRVALGGKTVTVRCMLCARDLAAQSPGAARVTGPTEDPSRPLTLTSDERGEWASSLPGVVFLEDEGDHALCDRWSRAFTSVAAFKAYVAANPRYRDQRPLTLVEWSTRQGKDAMDHPGTQGMEGMEGMNHAMGMGSMRGALGNWSMAREGSGTSWLPDDSPMFMKSLGKAGRFNLTYMGDFSLNLTDSNVAGGRGPREFYSNSMPMLMARRGFANGDTLGFRVMGSLDPVFNGQFGAPNLFQTGETAHGQPLVDRQHPHDLIAEVSATYTKSLGGDHRAFLYLAPIGEPALAGSMYLMRPSGMENPEAPITHHWFDSSHISFGVVTAGYELGSRYKIDGSFFNGKEPDENRYSPDDPRLDSATIRFTANPSKNLSLSASYASLHEPEREEPGDQHRLTANLHYGRLYRNGDALALTALFGRDLNEGRPQSDAYLAEASLYRKDLSYYARYENVQKDELVGVPEGRHTIDKWTFGATKDFAHRAGFDLGVGAYAGLYAFGPSLRDEYSSFPASLGVYFRLRPSRMSMGGMRM